MLGAEAGDPVSKVRSEDSVHQPPRVPWMLPTGTLGAVLLAWAVSCWQEHPEVTCGALRGGCDAYEQRGPVVTGTRPSLLQLGMPSLPEPGQYAPADRQCPPGTYWIKVGCWERVGEPGKAGEAPVCRYGSYPHPHPETGQPACWRALMDRRGGKPDRVPVSSPPEFRP